MIIIGIGGNVGTEDEIRRRFCAARLVLEAAEQARGNGDLRSAPLYRTAPIGPSQAPFLNTALHVTVDGDPVSVLRGLKGVEVDLGRRDAVRFGPRALDLDILVWDARVIDAPGLTVPHPRLHERRFALAPLVALLGRDFEIPGHGAAGALLDAVADQQVEQIAETW